MVVLVLVLVTVDCVLVSKLSEVFSSLLSVELTIRKKPSQLKVLTIKLIYSCKSKWPIFLYINIVKLKDNQPKRVIIKIKKGTKIK